MKLLLKYNQYRKCWDHEGEVHFGKKCYQVRDDADWGIIAKRMFFGIAAIMILVVVSALLLYFY